MLAHSTGNPWVELRFLHCLLGLSQGCPGSTRRGYICDEISQADGGCTAVGAVGGNVGLAMAWAVVVQLPAGGLA